MSTNKVQIDITELDFNDLSVIELPVSVANEKYLLREASGDAACKYRNSMLACTQLGPEGKPSSVKGMADCEPLLVSLCLFKADGKTPVHISIIRGWPDRVQKKLGATIKKISNMEDGEESVESVTKQINDLQDKLEKLKKAKEELKNGQELTTGGSP